MDLAYYGKLYDVFGHSFSINHLLRKYCRKIYDESRIAAAPFSLSLFGIRYTFWHTV